MTPEQVDVALINDDDTKSLMLMIAKSEAISITQLTQRARAAFVKAGKMGLMRVVTATHRGARYAFVGLTVEGARAVCEMKGKWTDELAMWAEEEGDSPAITHQQEVEKIRKEMDYFNKHTLGEG